MRYLVFVALLCCIFQFSSAEFVNTVLTARLEGQQVIPPGLADNTNLGTGVCTYYRNLNPPYLSCVVQNTFNLLVTTITSVSIYNSPRGLAATDPIYSFLNSTIQSNTNFLLTNLTASAGSDLATQESQFLNGNWYIQINTASLAIRGQLEHSDRVYSYLSYRQTIPAALSTNAYGVAVGVYSPTSPKRLLQLELINSVLSPTAVEVRAGTFGVVGPFIFSLLDYTSPIFAAIEVTVDEEDLLLHDLLYMTVPSTRNPDGDIRGQVTTIDYLPRAKFTSRIDNVLTSQSTNSAAEGCALWVYHCESSTLEYLVFHNVNNPTQAVVYNGIPGVNGTALFSLSRAQSPIYGSQQLISGYEQLLFNQTLFINIESTQFPDGEIVGGINTVYPYYAYLSGTYVVPPVTTSSIGCATFQIVGNDTLDFNVQFAVPNVLEVRLVEGPEGVNGIVDRLFPSNITPVFGDFLFTADNFNTLANGLYYVDITSDSYPIDGELRGQILSVNASCDAASQVAPFTIIFPPPPYIPIFTGSASLASASLLFALLALILVMFA